MKRQRIDSRALREVGYDAAARTLEVSFDSGRVYLYRDVPPEVFEWLLRVPHKGAFFNRKIKDAYPYTELDSAAPSAEPDLTAALRASLDSPGEDRGAQGSQRTPKNT